MMPYKLPPYYIQDGELMMRRDLYELATKQPIRNAKIVGRSISFHFPDGVKQLCKIFNYPNMLLPNTEQRTITKAYSRLDVEPVIEIQVGYTAIKQEDDWWQVNDKDGNKVCRMKTKAIEELTFEEAKYELSVNEMRPGCYLKCIGKVTTIDAGDFDNEMEDISLYEPILLTDELIPLFSLTFTEEVPVGEGSEQTFVTKTITHKFEDNTLRLPRNNQLEYDPESNLFSLNGIFLPNSPKYVHQLQNLIFGLTFIDPVINQ